MDIERNLGEQPLSKILTDLGLKSHELVEASTEHITHKMVKRACKGRRCTPNTKTKIRDALNAATEKTYSLDELFTY